MPSHTTEDDKYKQYYHSNALGLLNQEIIYLIRLVKHILYVDIKTNKQIDKQKTFQCIPSEVHGWLTTTMSKERSLLTPLVNVAGRNQVHVYFVSNTAITQFPKGNVAQSPGLYLIYANSGLSYFRLYI